MTKRRYKITIQYDGTAYCGWQRQRNALSVQELLESAVREMNRNQAVSVIGAGRTDSGVHALGQVAHFDLITDYRPETIRAALNAKTPRDIHISACERVAADFHARYSARRRMYQYRILTATSPVERLYSWQLAFRPAMDRLTKCARMLRGEHDFTRFCKQSCEAETRVCHIFQADWIQQGERYTFSIQGNRFVHSMVRMLVGTMIEVARGKYEPTDFQNLLDNQPDSVQVYTAPPGGLFLESVKYE